jgi:septum site-determining protein MinD
MIAIAGGKGGCGKTTSTVGLARSTPEATIIIDADITLPNLSTRAGAPQASSSTLTRSIDPDDTTTIIETPQSKSQLQSRLAQLETAQEMVYIDCPAGATPAAAIPLRFASAIIAITTPTTASITDTLKTITMATTLKAPCLGVMCVKTTEHDHSVADCFESPLLSVVPFDPAPLRSTQVHLAFKQAISNLYQYV